MSITQNLKDGKCCTASSLDTDGTVFSETGTIFYRYYTFLNYIWKSEKDLISNTQIFKLIQNHNLFRMVPSEMFAYTNINTCEFVGDTCRTGKVN